MTAKPKGKVVKKVAPKKPIKKAKIDLKPAARQSKPVAKKMLTKQKDKDSGAMVTGKSLVRESGGKSTAVKVKPKVAPSVAKVEKIVSKKGVTTGPDSIKPYASKHDEPYMSEQQLHHFEVILNAWKNELMREVDQTIYDMQGVANYPDPIDRASQEEEFSLKLRERDRERKLLKKIGEALLRIKEHSYGYCDECGAEIGVRRLEARPTATQCIDCKTIAEIREKQTGGGS